MKCQHQFITTELLKSSPFRCQLGLSALGKMPAVERLIAMGLQFKLAEINEGRVQEKEGERILVVISWQSFASIIIII